MVLDMEDELQDGVVKMVDCELQGVVVAVV